MLVFYHIHTTCNNVIQSLPIIIWCFLIHCTHHSLIIKVFNLNIIVTIKEVKIISSFVCITSLISINQKTEIHLLTFIWKSVDISWNFNSLKHTAGVAVQKIDCSTDLFIDWSTFCYYLLICQFWFLYFAPSFVCLFCCIVDNRRVNRIERCNNSK